MRVHEHPHTKPGRQTLGDERDPGGAADQEDRVEVVGLDGRGVERVLERVKGLVDEAGDSRFELGPMDDDLLQAARGLGIVFGDEN